MALDKKDTLRKKNVSGQKAKSKKAGKTGKKKVTTSEEVNDDVVTKESNKRRKTRSIAEEKDDAGENTPESNDTIAEKEAGLEEYLEEARNLCKSQNDEMELINSKAKTGTTFISQKKYDFLLKHFLVIDRYEKADVAGKAALKDEYVSSMSSMKNGWKYSFRLKWYGDEAKIQKPSSAYSEKKTKPKSAAAKHKDMKESDWSVAVPCDSYECFKTLNDLHWKTSCNRDHHKSHSLYKLASESEFSHNVTSNICGFISQACPICKSSNIGRKRKVKTIEHVDVNNTIDQVETITNLTDNPNSVLAEVEIAEAEPKLVQYGMIKISERNGTESSFLLDVMVVAYLSQPNKIDILPLNNRHINEIGGLLIESFMRNGCPTHLDHVSLSATMFEDGKFLTQTSSTTEGVLIYVNSWNLPHRNTIKTSVKTITSKFILDTVKILHEAFTLKRVIILFSHSRVVLSYLKHAINIDLIYEKDDPLKAFLDTYLSSLEIKYIAGLCESSLFDKEPEGHMSLQAHGD